MEFDPEGLVDLAQVLLQGEFVVVPLDFLAAVVFEIEGHAIDSQEVHDPAAVNQKLVTLVHVDRGEIDLPGEIVRFGLEAAAVQFPDAAIAAVVGVIDEVVHLVVDEGRADGLDTFDYFSVIEVVIGAGDINADCVVDRVGGVAIRVVAGTGDGVHGVSDFIHRILGGDVKPRFHYQVYGH